MKIDTTTNMNIHSKDNKSTWKYGEIKKWKMEMCDDDDIFEHTSGKNVIIYDYKSFSVLFMFQHYLNM